MELRTWPAPGGCWDARDRSCIPGPPALFWRPPFLLVGNIAVAFPVSLLPLWSREGGLASEDHCSRVVLGT